MLGDHSIVRSSQFEQEDAMVQLIGRRSCVRERDVVNIFELRLSLQIIPQRGCNDGGCSPFSKYLLTYLCYVETVRHSAAVSTNQHSSLIVKAVASPLGMLLLPRASFQGINQCSDRECIPLLAFSCMFFLCLSQNLD